MSAAGSGDTTGEARPDSNTVAGTEHACQRPGNHRPGNHRPGNHPTGRHGAAPAVTLAPVEAVPLDAEHERLALVYLAELVAPLFGSDGSA
ncbi:MAG: hypothetical protein ACYCUG_08370 [Acidimicrobiales bacterium]